MFLSQSLLTLVCFLGISLINGPSLTSPPPSHPATSFTAVVHVYMYGRWSGMGKGHNTQNTQGEGACKQFIPRATTLNNCRGHYSRILCTVVLLLLAEGRGQVITLGILPVFVTQCPYPQCRPLFYPYCFYSRSRPVVFNWVQFCPCSQGLFGNVYKHFSCHNLEEHLVGRGSGMLPNVLQCIGQHPLQRMIPPQISIVLRWRNWLQRSPSVFPPFPSIIHSNVAYSL